MTEGIWIVSSRRDIDSRFRFYARCGSLWLEIDASAWKFGSDGTDFYRRQAKKHESHF